MKVTLVRFVSLLLLLAFGSSALSVFAPSLSSFPVFFFALAVALALSRGFFEAFPTALVAGLLVDVSTLGRIGLGSAFIVGLAYTASFFSRRFVVEHGVMTYLFSGLLVGAVAFAYPFFAGALLDGRDFFGGGGAWALFSWGNALFAFGGGVVLFPAAAWLLRVFDERTAYLDSQNIVRR